jgi:chorismate dehydratase
MTQSVFVFAGAPYSNSAPLVDKLTEVDSRVKIIHDHPANLVADLNAGKADVALIPVAHLFRHPELTMLKGLGVAADGPVKSVLLKCKVPLQEIKTVGRDPASATSNALAELLLKNHFGLDVEMQELKTSGQVDAMVVIGDRAICAEPAPAGDIDLAGAWKEMTGLPFVFAVWAVRKDFSAIETVTEIAHKACQMGMESVEEISTRYVDELGQSSLFWQEYLSHTIHYQLNQADLDGMNRFRVLIGL